MAEHQEFDQVAQDLHETYCSTCKDHFMQNLSDLGLKEPLRRLILVGKLKFSNKPEVKLRHEEMIKNIQENIMDDSSKLTGLMIIQKSYFYHIAEGSDEALNEVIESTANFVKQKLLNKAKVVIFVTASFRYFEVWNICVILTSDDQMDKSEMVIESDILNLAKKMQKFEDVVFVLASYVRYLKQGEVSEKINDLLPTSVLPFENELEDLCSEQFFLNVEEYVKRYLVLYDYTSYIEQEWPPTGPVHDATDYFKELDTFERCIDEALKSEEDPKKKGKHASYK